MRTQEDTVAALSDRRARLDQPRFLGHRVTLAGQGGLIDEERLGGKDATVSRHHVAGPKHHDVARHHLFDGDLDFLAISENIRMHLDRSEQCPHRVHGTAFLEKPEPGACEHDHEDDRRVDRIAEEDRQHGGPE